MTKRLTLYGRPDQLAYDSFPHDYNRSNFPVVRWVYGAEAGLHGRRLAKMNRHKNPRPVLRGGRPNLPAWF